MEHLRNTPAIINVFYDLPPNADSESTEESMSFSEWAKPFCVRIIITVYNVKHDSERAWVKPISIPSEAKTNDFGASCC